MSLLTTVRITQTFHTLGDMARWLEMHSWLLARKNDGYTVIHPRPDDLTRSGRGKAIRNASYRFVDRDLAMLFKLTWA